MHRAVTWRLLLQAYKRMKKPTFTGITNQSVDQPTINHQYMNQTQAHRHLFQLSVILYNHLFSLQIFTFSISNNIFCFLISTHCNYLLFSAISSHTLAIFYLRNHDFIHILFSLHYNNYFSLHLGLKILGMKGIR